MWTAAAIGLMPEATALQCNAESCEVAFADGSTRVYDTLYPLLGSDNQSQLALSLGAAVDDEAALRTDAHQQTTVDGLYVAGDVAVDLNQISVAAGHAAIASTAIHNRL